MGRQDDFTVDVTSKGNIVTSTNPTETAIYITDLLAELQTIANISGLTGLSMDIDAVIEKHMKRTPNA